jgi:HEAT repeat protein
MLCLAIAIAGCRADTPIMSHGQPVSHWLEEARSPDPKARRMAVRALGAVGAKDEAVVPALIAAIKDVNVDVRRETVLALLNIGPPAKDAIPTLREATADPDPRVRLYAAKAIEKIEDTAPGE